MACFCRSCSASAERALTVIPLHVSMEYGTYISVWERECM